jgi:hypothetical protein
VGKIALPSSPRKRGPMITGRWLWVPALRPLRGRRPDDSWMARRINLRVYGVGAAAASCFGPVLYREGCNSHVFRRIEPRNSLHGDVVVRPHAAARGVG